MLSQGKNIDVNARMTKAPCAYVFYKEVEEGENFVYVYDKPYCFECLQKAIDIMDSVYGANKGTIVIAEES